MKLYNSATRTKEELVTKEPGVLRMYTCGPTVYHFAHIGNLRSYIMEDVLEKYLTYIGYKVHRTMNITDVGHLSSDADEGEDKMLKGARREHKTVMEIARYYTDAFFADKKTLDNYYVIPLKMTGVQGADSILQGKAVVANPMLTNSGDWSVQPKNFVLYAVKYVNPWHGEYLRRGVDQAVINGVSSQLVRHQQYVEKDEKVNITTESLKDNILSLSTKDAQGNLFNYNLSLTFTEDGNCTVGSTSDDLIISGTGKFVKKGEKNSLGGKDRNAIYLDYTIDFKTKNMQYATKDTLVLSSRAVQGGKSFEIEIR